MLGRGKKHYIWVLIEIRILSALAQQFTVLFIWKVGSHIKPVLILCVLVNLIWLCNYATALLWSWKTLTSHGIKSYVFQAWKCYGKQCISKMFKKRNDFGNLTSHVLNLKLGCWLISYLLKEIITNLSNVLII